MAFQTVFKRYEIKYLLSLKQKDAVLSAMAPYMAMDHYGRSLIRNLYFDTPNYRMIRRSIEKPVYKEKLRLRAYGEPQSDATVFVELKKKFEQVVYKRRVALGEKEALEWLLGKRRCERQTQITDEIDYVLGFYENLRPTVFLSYQREAYFCREGSDFRVTFDDTILWRAEDLSLSSPIYGEPLLPSDTVLMEIKCSGGIPLWMCAVLTEQGLYKTSFSKYGTTYQIGLKDQITFCHNKENSAYV